MDLRNNNHLSISFPQWQGSGPSNVLYYGAKALEKHLAPLKFNTIDVPVSETLNVVNHILGYDSILSQHQTICKTIEARAPETIFILGGDCGVELAPVSYLNTKYKNNFSLVWFDAHADLNTPTSSPSKHFHGMPLRTLLGEGDSQLIQKCFSTLNTEQVIFAGTREFDKEELEFIKTNNMTRLSVDTVSNNFDTLTGLLKKNKNKNIYLHIDLDVLNPDSYHNIKHPTPNGITVEILTQAIDNLSQSFNIVGLGITEYLPDPDKKNSGLSEIKAIIDLFK